MNHPEYGNLLAALRDVAIIVFVVVYIVQHT